MSDDATGQVPGSPNRRARPTIRDVARHAGVGRGTVSRVLNDQPNVAAKTRVKVERTIAELQFVPNPMGRQLSLGRSMAIGVIAPFLTRPSVVERLSGVAASLAGTDYAMIAFDVESVERRDAVFRDVLVRHQLDGLIVISLRPHSTEVDYMARAGIACVLVDTSHPLLPRVVVDDVAGERVATRYLIELGHRRLLFLGDLPDSVFSFSSSRLRSWGFRRALVEAGLPFDPAQIRVARHARTTARELAHQILTAPEPPTGIVCASDTQALGVLEAARSLGISVPFDLSVVGYDDIDTAAYADLTTIRQPLVQSGARGSARIQDALAGRPMGPLREALPVELVVRGSTTSPR
jgi:DNA-binding LacI/PurR family transcriptional regulator